MMFNKKENTGMKKNTGMSMVDILKHAFYNSPGDFYHLSHDVNTRLNVMSLGPIVTRLAELHKAAPKEELEQEILRHIVRIGLAYDKEYGR